VAAGLRIDTLKFAKRLTEAGLTPAAAEAIVEGLNDADFSELATKSDIAEARSEIAEVRADLAAFKLEVKAEFTAVKSEFAAVRSQFTAVNSEFAAVRGEIRTEIATLRADIYSRLWAMGLGIVGLTVALIKLLPG
jgi:hypothetical protein